MADAPSELQAEIETLERKHTDNPEGRFFVPLANAYRKVGEVEQAEALLREGLRRHPDYLSAHIVLGRCLADRGAAAAAEEEFRHVLSVDPQNLIALRTLGELAAAAGREEQAGRWFRELLSVDPMNEDARQALESLEAGAAPQGEEPVQPGGGWWEAGAESPEPAPAAEPAPDAGFELGSARTEREAEPAPDVEPARGDADADVYPLAGDLVELDGDEPGPVEEEADAPEVVTETIAELYARQGFRDRAADVYRQLIRRRGGDPALERRLEELEGRSATLAAPAPAAPADDAALDDGFDGSFDQGFGGGEADETLPTYPPAEPESPPETLLEPAPLAAPAPSGRSIRETLAALAAWAPGREPAPTPLPPLEPVAEPAPLDEPVGVDRASAAAPPPWAAEVESEPAREPAPPPPPVAADGEGQAAGTIPAEEPLFPWEIPADEDVAAPPAPEPQALPEPSAPEPADLQALFSAPAKEARAEAPAAAEPDAGSGEPADDEDDLESFQSWLRSLKR